MVVWGLGVGGGEGVGGGNESWDSYATLLIT